MRTAVSRWIKLLTVILAVTGIVLNFIYAERDGYSHWSVRLLYFTAISNIWIAFCFAAMLLRPYIRRLEESECAGEYLYILRYVFTVSITLTGFIFFAVLAPGAGNADYNAWTLASFLTHLAVPILSIVDMFVDPYRVKLLKRHIAYTAVPPFIYLIFVSMLVILKVDFGRGDPYPYIFFNYYSPAGFFGFSDQMPYIFGSFYWIILMLALVLGVGSLYRRLYNNKR